MADATQYIIRDVPTHKLEPAMIGLLQDMKLAIESMLGHIPDGLDFPAEIAAIKARLDALESP